MMHHGSSSDAFHDLFFLDVKEGVDEMIEFLANEPSVGLFFVQQHAQTSMPYLLSLSEKVGEKIHEVNLHTEDMEDSISSVRSMTEYGIPIVDGMFKDINRSLRIMSASQPKRGLIRNPSWGDQISTSSPQHTFSYSIGSDPSEGSSRSYLSAVLNSAKQKAAELRWSLPNAMAKCPSNDLHLSVMTSQVTRDVSPATTDTEGDELPLSSRLLDNQLDEMTIATESLYIQDKSSLLQDYDKFNSEREARFREWLQETENHGRRHLSSN